MSAFSATFARFAEPATRRRSTGSYNAGTGVWTPSAPSDTAIVAVVQPIGEDVQFLPENLRSSEAVKIFSETELRPATSGSSGDADLVVTRGKTYRVVAVDHWISSQDYYKALAVKQ